MGLEGRVLVSLHNNAASMILACSKLHALGAQKASASPGKNRPLFASSFPRPTLEKHGGGRSDELRFELSVFVSVECFRFFVVYLLVFSFVCSCFLSTFLDFPRGRAIDHAY